MADWSPEKYLAFANERARPAMDLMQRIPRSGVQLIHDLGCGPGNSTKLLRDAFPSAQISAIDASPAMIAKAQSLGVDAAFLVGDVVTWSPDPAADLVFSNALFQWVPKHEQQILRIFNAMKSGSVLAIQMPDNLGEASHRMMPLAAVDFMEKTTSDHIVNSRSSLLTATGYFDLLAPLSKHTDVWRTTYHHRLKSHLDIAEFFSSTGLKPWLDAIAQDKREDFLQVYARMIAPHYAKLADGGVVYPFPRLFILAVRA
jgi:trans-aconitate 2-methyltransferase